MSGSENERSALNESPPPIWQIIRDVHHIDGRVKVLETIAAQQAVTLGEIKDSGARTANAVTQMRDSVVGWKTALALIAFLLGLGIPVLVFALSRFFPAVP